MLDSNAAMIAEDEYELEPNTSRIYKTIEAASNNKSNRQLDYSDFGRVRKSKGFEQFPHFVQPKLYFLRDSYKRRQSQSPTYNSGENVVQKQTGEGS